MNSRIPIRDFTHVPRPQGEKSTASDRRRVRYPKGLSEAERRKWREDNSLGRTEP